MTASSANIFNKKTRFVSNQITSKVITMQAGPIVTPLLAEPFKVCLEREVFLSVHTWNDIPRVDLRLFNAGYPTKKGCILNASRWAILMDNLDEIEKKMGEVQEGNLEIDLNIHLGANLYAAVHSPYAILDIRLRFMNEGKLLHTTKELLYECMA